MKSLLNKKTSIYIYLAISIIFISSMVITNSFSLNGLSLYLVISFLTYILLTRSWDMLITVISIYVTLSASGFLPEVVAGYTGLNATPLFGTPLVGLFGTLLLVSPYSRIEWTIRSPFLANILGEVGAVTFVLAFSILGKGSIFFLTGMSLIIYFLIVITFLTFGSKVAKIPPLSSVTMEEEDSLLAHLEDAGVITSYSQDLRLFKDKEGGLLTVVSIDGYLTHKKNTIHLVDKGERVNMFAWFYSLSTLMNKLTAISLKIDDPKVKVLVIGNSKTEGDLSFPIKLKNRGKRLDGFFVYRDDNLEDFTSRVNSTIN